MSPKGMSHADTLTASTTATTAADSAPILLACPHCGSTEHLRTVELVEVLAEARFTIGTAEPDYGSETQLLPDTQHWQPDSGAIVCRNCDQVDLRYGDLVPAIFLADPAPSGAPVVPAQTPGATS